MSTNEHNYNTFDLPYQHTGFDEEMAHAKKNRGGCCFFACCSGCLLFVLLIILIIVGIWYCLSGGVPLEVSPETTVITEPLKKDGTVDFYRAIKEMIEPKVLPNDNGFMDVVQGYGPIVYGFDNFDHIDNEFVQQYLALCDTYGLDPKAKPAWTLPALQGDVQRWLTEVNEGLNAVQVAAAKPHYFIPLERVSERDLVLVSQPITAYVFHEKLSNALRARANLRFQAGDSADAWKDILTSARLFRQVTFHYAWHIAVNNDDNQMEAMLLPVTEIVAALSKWTPEQLTQGIQDLESLPDWQDRETMLKKLQFFLLDIFSSAHDIPELLRRTHNDNDNVEIAPLVYVLQSIGFDWNRVAKELNGKIKEYGELLKQAADKSLDEQFQLLSLRLPGEPRTDLSDPKELQRMLEDRIKATDDMSMNPLLAPGRSKFSGILAGDLVTWVAGEMYRVQLMEESRCQALRLALALERYHREHKMYPDTLEALGLQPMKANMSLQYQKLDSGYRIENKVFRLEK